MITTTEGSFIKRYGILAVPMIFMMCLGSFGFRCGQLTRGIWTCLINFFFFLSIILLLMVLNIVSITPKNVENPNGIFMFLTFFCFLIHYILLIYKYYKKYNMYCLFEDVRNVRLNRLSNLETLKVFFLLFLCLLLLVYILYSILAMILVAKYNYLNIVTTDPLWNTFLMILHPFLSTILVFMSIVCLSFMTSVFAIGLAREFDQCNRDLKDKITSDKYLTYDTFMKTTKRFNELANMVDKVNEMTCDLVAIPLAVALGSLCFTIYYTIISSSTIIEIFAIMINVCQAILIVILLLPQGMSLNEKVKLILFVVFF